MTRFRTILPGMILPGMILLGLGPLGCDATRSTSKNKDGTMTFGVVPMSAQHDFWKSIHAGAIKAGKELGVEIIWKAPLKNENLQEQIDIVESLGVRGVDGLVLAPVDRNALVSPVENSVRRGIPVVIVDSALESDQQISFIATDNYQGGVDGGHQLARLLDGKGKVIMLRSYEGVASSMNREQAFLDTMEEYPDIEVVSSNQRTSGTSESAYRKAEQLLARFKTAEGDPSIDGIFTSCEPCSFGMMRAMEDSNLVGRIAHVGFDASPALVQGLRNGHLDAIVVQDPIKMGYLGVKTLVAHLKGEQIDRRYDTGVYVITRENVDDPKNKDIVEPDLDQWFKD